MGDNGGVESDASMDRKAASPPADDKTQASSTNQGMAKSQTRPSRRKKASRACYHCQKAHLTCDDSRPCQRCVRKGLADQCVDGYRKKAKYLLEEDEIPSSVPPIMAHGKPAPNPNENMFLPNIPDKLPASSSLNTGYADPVLLEHIPPNGVLRTTRPNPNTPMAPSHYVQSDSGSHLPTDTSNHVSWGNEPASLESSILTSMIHDLDSAKPSADSPDGPSIPAMDLMESYTHISNMTSGDDAPGESSLASAYHAVPAPQSNLFGTPGQSTFSPLTFMNAPSNVHMSDPPTLGKDGITPVAAAASSSFGTHTTLPTPNNHNHIHTDHHGQHHQQPQPQQQQQPLPSDSQSMNPTSSSLPQPRPGMPYRPESELQVEQLWKQRVSKVYRDNTRPFPYTEGYHILLKYATQKYEKADVLRIVRALAIYRPSLIALQMPLSEEDEIFVERAFQRTILEFEKLISFSGTPTVVWRRTCEIALVGAEFCMLTQWSKEDLLGKYIYQFMDKESVLNYWEMFASHAFENTTQSVMTKCVLLSPSNKSIPCTWCFTIKRDPFDLPGFVVGNVRYCQWQMTRRC